MLLVRIFESNFDPHKNSNPIYETKSRNLFFPKKIYLQGRLATLERVHEEISECFANLNFNAFSKAELANLKKNVVILNAKFDKHNQKLVQIHWLYRWFLSWQGIRRLDNLPITQIENALKAKRGSCYAIQIAPQPPNVEVEVRCSADTQSNPPRNLLDLPADILRLILQTHLPPFVAMKLARFVCRRFKQLIPAPPLESERWSRAPVIRFAHECASLGYLKVLQWAYANKCPILGINQEAA